VDYYLVGGAVRDVVLGLPVWERDWVVVGANVEVMLAEGYRAVGKDFPVFLHPETNEEYALARTERKVAKGYQGFTFHADESVTLLEDLSRRDLTINAMARGREDDILVDPYGGEQDCRDKVLRHVSPAFVEDPVRVLRLARFAAYLPDFTVAEETLALVREMVVNGEVAALVSERVWREVSRALQMPAPQRFFQVLMDGGALSVLMPEFADHDAEWLQHVARICATEAALEVRFAAIWGQCSVATLAEVAGRMRVSAAIMDGARLLAAWGEQVHHLSSISAEDLLTLLLKMDAFRRVERLHLWLQAAQVAYDVTVDSARLLRVVAACQSIDVSVLQARGLEGSDLGAAIDQERLAILRRDFCVG
jgi:tRNA nucleotidyltransferase (CCA-adding enzyme)